MRGDEAFHIPTPRPIRGQRSACQHHLQDLKQLFGDLEVTLVAGVMERDQDLIRQSPTIARRRAVASIAPGIFVSLAHLCPYRLPFQRMAR